MVRKVVERGEGEGLSAAEIVRKIMVCLNVSERQAQRYRRKLKEPERGVSGS